MKRARKGGLIFNKSIKYIPGLQMYISDLLSRQPDKNAEHIDLDQQIAHIQFHEKRLCSLQQATRDDTT